MSGKLTLTIDASQALAMLEEVKAKILEIKALASPIVLDFSPPTVATQKEIGDQIGKALRDSFGASTKEPTP